MLRNVLMVVSALFWVSGCVSFDRPKCSASSDCGPTERCIIASGVCAVRVSMDAASIDPDSGRLTDQGLLDAAADMARPDAAPVDAAPVDAAPVDAAPVDAAPVDAAPVDAEPVDAEPVDAEPVDAEPCADACTPCIVGDALGPCRHGLLICGEGDVQRCVSNWPVGAARPCDLIDNDCDGETDEAGELTINPGADAVVFARCESAGARVPQTDARCQLDQGEQGGACPVEACAPVAVRTRCDRQRIERNTACQTADDLLVCLDDSMTQWLDCLAVDDFAGAPWVCGEDGGNTCRPTAEICNNGVDEDGDGLIDGSVGQPGVCMASITEDLGLFQMGLCDDPEGEGCLEEEQRMSVEGQHPEDRAAPGQSPRMVGLNYTYGVDREEVSIRAYLECQRSGCCGAPSGQVWDRVASWARVQETLPPRSPSRCAGAPAIDADPAALLDLPVTGVNWCQARDYCEWAGKRLVTETEWERAATGRQRKAYAWGDGTPSRCAEDQCCVAPNQDAPGFCGAGVPECREAIPEVSRLACLGHYPGTEGCHEAFELPTPVWGSSDGATEAGVVNMNGNVGEWVFDWFRARYRGQSTANPAGPACDESSLPNKRAVRGMPVGRRRSSINNFGREALFGEMRSAQVGFRCSRTLGPIGQRCAAGTPDIRHDCRPEGPEANCGGPDLIRAEGGDLEECSMDNDLRRGSGQCEDLVTLCSTDVLIDQGGTNGCDSFILSELDIQVIDAGQFSIDLVGLVMEPSLAPNGGQALIAFGVESGFPGGEDNLGSVDIQIGTAVLTAQGLMFAGIRSGPNCEPMPYFVDSLAKSGANTFRSGCNIGDTRLKFDGLPINLHLSALGHQFRYVQGTDTLEATLQFVLTREDIDASVLGEPGGLGEALWPLLRDPNSGQYTDLDLCTQQLDRCDAALLVEGCVNGACPEGSEASCRGIIFPANVVAVRARNAGLSRLSCELPAAEN